MSHLCEPIYGVVLVCFGCNFGCAKACPSLNLDLACRLVSVVGSILMRVFCWDCFALMVFVGVCGRG